MRQILFRGFYPNDNDEEQVYMNGKWTKGKWIYGDFIHRRRRGHDIALIHCDDNGIDNYYEYYVIPETAGQYTGLVDKNETKIFEGDIINGKDKLEPNIELYGYVDFKNGSFVIEGELMTHYRWMDYEVEVVGNIYDIPKPLGEEREGKNV